MLALVQLPCPLATPSSYKRHISTLMKCHWSVRSVTALHAGAPPWPGQSRAVSLPSAPRLSPRTDAVHAGVADAPGWTVYARVSPDTGQGVLPGTLQDTGPGSRSYRY